MKNLYQPGVCACLQEPDRGRTTVVLSTLQNIFLEGIEPLGLVQEDIEQFIAARELSRFPCPISLWNSALVLRGLVIAAGSE
jgi:hypothetical protein